MPSEPENVAVAPGLEPGAFLEGETLRKSGARNGNTAFFAPVASDFAFRCSRSRRSWTGQSLPAFRSRRRF